MHGVPQPGHRPSADQRAAVKRPKLQRLCRCNRRPRSICSAWAVATSEIKRSQRQATGWGSVCMLRRRPAIMCAILFAIMCAMMSVSVSVCAGRVCCPRVRARVCVSALCVSMCIVRVVHVCCQRVRVHVCASALCGCGPAGRTGRFARPAARPACRRSGAPAQGSAPPPPPAPPG